MLGLEGTDVGRLFFFWGGSVIRLIIKCRQVMNVKVKLGAYDVAARGLGVDSSHRACFLV